MANEECEYFCPEVKNNGKEGCTNCLEIAGVQICRTAIPQLPDLQDLTQALCSIFNRPLKIIDRKVNPAISTFASEIITCDAGEQFKIFGKYESGHRHRNYGHRGRVPYEAEVYKQIIQQLQISKPGFYGSYKDRKTGDTWLFIEYLDNCLRVNRAGDPSTTMRLAASWIGEFHRSYQSNGRPAAFLKKYDREYYTGWMDRTLEFSRGWNQRFPWLDELSRNTDWIRYLADLPQTVIHGEYYPANILYRDGLIYPIDWESAALAVGEIDLASLTEGWPNEDMRICEDSYKSARWGDSPPSDFSRRLSAARLYLELRWLGDNPEWTSMRRSIARYERIFKEGQRLGILPHSAAFEREKLKRGSD